MVLLAGVAGAVGTAGWFDISLTSTWEGGEISLSSASSLLALSVALTLLQGWGKSRPLQILVAVLALAAGGTLAILLWAGLAGVPLEGIWRDWFTSAASRRAGGGSPWTAASWTLFALLAAIGLLGLFPPLAARRWGRVVSITAVLLGVTFSLLVAALRAAGAGVLIPLAFRPTASFTAVGFAALFVGIGLAQGLLSRSLVLFAGSVAADLPESLQERRKRLYLALAVLLVVLATALGGTGYLGLHLVQEQRQVRSTLSAVAKLKVEQIALWRRERAGDAEALRENPVFRNAPEGFAPELLDEATRARWTRFLESFRRAYSYRSIELFDRELRPMLAVAAGALPVQPVDPTQAQLLRRANEIAWRDLRREADGSIGLQLLVPLRRESDGEFAGLFRLTIDARQALFPLVQNPHGEKGTTELLLYRQEGTRILYLSELRFRPEAALQFVDAIRPRRLVSEPDAFAHQQVQLTADEFVVFIRDITQRKRIEAETALMLEKEREVSEMKTRFISVTSHEFRTPMAVALGSLEILRNYLERLAPAKRDELFVRITESLQRMTSMLDDMLTLSRVDAGRTRVEFAGIDLPQFLQRVVDEVRIADRDAHVFVLNVEGDANGFHSDSNILHHIVSNLLINAAHYSGAGTTIAVTLQVDATQARLAIADKGIGISEADIKRIFDAFERGSNVGMIKGSGLGLNIVKRMTDILGGKVTVESTLGVGTCFTVEIPARNAGAA